MLLNAKRPYNKDKKKKLRNKQQTYQKKTFENVPKTTVNPIISKKFRSHSKVIYAMIKALVKLLKSLQLQSS